jgi:hypothetical protein
MRDDTFSFGRRLAAWPVLGVCVLLSACFHMPSLNSPPGPVYDVRAASVVSGAGASPGVLAGVTERLNAAIAATPQKTGMPAVTLTIRITQSERAQGYQKDRNTAKVDIDASAVDTGSVIAVTSFESTSFSGDASSIDDLMADDIAARIRAIYLLTAPRLVN